MEKNKKLNFCSLEEAFSAIGKKFFSDQWKWQKNFKQIDTKIYQQHLDIAHIFQSLIEKGFFDIYKTDGTKILENEKIILFEDENTLSKFTIPQEQFDYVLKTGGRYKDSLSTKFPRVLVQTIVFRAGTPFDKVFNTQKTHEIKNLLEIKDFDHWLNKKDLKEDHVYLVMLGVNPEYYRDFLSEDEKLEVCSRKLMSSFKKSGSQYYELNVFINNIKTTSEVAWKGNWKKLIDGLYRKGLFFDSNFSINCSNFLAYLKEKNHLPTYFDKFLNHKIFRPNFDRFLKIEKKLNQQDVTCLAMGLEPHYAALYAHYRAKVTQANGLYSALEKDKKIFFYKSYDAFVQSNSINFLRHFNSIFDIKYNRNLFEFFRDLTNLGFVFDRNLTLWLYSKNKNFSGFPQNSRTYRTLLLFGEMQYWSLRDFSKIIAGVNPLNNRTIMSFLGEESVNKLYFFPKDKDEQSYMAFLKASNEYHDIEPLLIKTGLKREHGYNPKELIKWIVKHTYVAVPEEILKFVFKDDRELNEIKGIISQNEADHPSQEELNKAKYQITLTTRNTEPALFLVKNFREAKEELLCHILRKENATWFHELFDNDKISLERDALEKFAKAINNAFDKIDDKQIRSRLRNGFFEVTANSVILKTKEISF